MVATAFPKGLTKGEAAEFVNRLFSDEEGYREQALADLTGLIKSNLSKQAEEKEMNHGDEGREGSGARRSQRRDENREASAGRADHGCRRGRDSVFYLDVRSGS
jgi:hypothetical protein